MKLICTITLFCIFFWEISAQDKKFYVVDTISVESPIVYSLNNYDGLFLIDKVNFNKNCIKYKSIINNPNIFLFSFNPYVFLNEDQLLRQQLFKNYQNNGDCSFSRRDNEKNKIYYNTFEDKPKKFIVCLIKASYYDEKVSTADIGKTPLHKITGNNYFKILFPVCE